MNFPRPSGPAATTIALAVSVALVGCDSGSRQASGAAALEPRRGGTVVIGSISDVDSWNEYVSRQSFAYRVLRRMYLELARETGDVDTADEPYEPELAESWSFADDGRSLTFRLREAVWSDGRPITADDVRFTWDAQRSPDVPWISAESKDRITDVEVVDARTVTFRFDDVYPFRLADAVTGGILPKHVFGEVPFGEWATHDWSSARVASGPFVLDRHDAANEIVLVRNPKYFRSGYPLLDRVVIRIVPDIGNLVTQLMAGEVDYVEGVPPRDAERLGGASDVAVIAFDYPQYDFIGWNGARAPFGDAEIRRALTLAVDRNALVEELLYGYGKVSKGPVPSTWWGANDGFEPWGHDPDEARRILAAKGYGPEGTPLRIDLLTNSGNRLREEMLVKIQEQLRRVGVEATVHPVEMRTMRQQVASGDYDGYLGGWAFFGKVDLRSLFGSSATPPHGINVVGYRSNDVDGLLDALDRARTKQEMKPKLDAIQLAIHDDQPYTFLYEMQKITAHAPHLHGVKIVTPSDTLADLEQFWID